MTTHLIDFFFLSQVEIVMQRGVVVVDLMMHTLLNFTQPDDPELRIDLENVTVIVAKQTVENYNNGTIETNHGTLDVPDVTSLIDVDELGCVEQTLFFASYLYVDTASNVNSHTMQFNLEICDVVNASDVISTGNDVTERSNATSNRTIENETG